MVVRNKRDAELSKMPAKSIIYALSHFHWAGLPEASLRKIWRLVDAEWDLTTKALEG